jgi:hypothetical protein
MAPHKKYNFNFFGQPTCSTYFHFRVELTFKWKWQQSSVKKIQLKTPKELVMTFVYCFIKYLLYRFSTPISGILLNAFG